MDRRSNPETVLDVLDAVETRDVARLGALYHPDIEFNWPPSLPYGGTHRGADVAAMSYRFGSVWGPLQPTEAERRMDPVVVSASGDDVIVRYTWKGRDSAGRSIAADTLAHYEVRDGKLARAKMYHYDLTALLDFLSAAKR
jgi:ketosteroid isomerase-like protein